MAKCRELQCLVACCRYYMTLCSITRTSSVNGGFALTEVGVAKSPTSVEV